MSVLVTSAILPRNNIIGSRAARNHSKGADCTKYYETPENVFYTSEIKF